MEEREKVKILTAAWKGVHVFHGFRLCSAFLTCDVLLCAIFSTCRIEHVLCIVCGNVVEKEKVRNWTVG